MLYRWSALISELGGGGVLLECEEKISREGEIFILKGGWFDKFERAKISWSSQIIYFHAYVPFVAGQNKNRIELWVFTGVNIEFIGKNICD